MENNRKYFIVPLEYAEELDLFTNEQLGELFRALLHYSAYGTDSDSNSFPIKLMYRILKKVLTRILKVMRKSKIRDVMPQISVGTKKMKMIQMNTKICKAMQTNAKLCKAIQTILIQKQIQIQKQI